MPITILNCLRGAKCDKFEMRIVSGSFMWYIRSCLLMLPALMKIFGSFNFVKMVKRLAFTMADIK